MINCSYNHKGVNGLKKTEELKAEILMALGHPNRIRIVESLREGKKCNCELVVELGLEQSNLSRHLKVLIEAGILISWREGVRMSYRIADKRIYEILELAGIIARSNIEMKAKALKGA